jgi:hypothetical protein
MSTTINNEPNQASLSKHEYSERMRTLRNIEYHLRLIKSPFAVRGPKEHFAIVCALCTICMILALFYETGNRPSFFIAFAGGMVAFFLALRYSKRPRTYMEKIDQILVTYDPINKDEYRYLQQRTKELGCMEVDLVHKWLVLEREAVRVEAHDPQSVSYDFLNKKI